MALSIHPLHLGDAETDTSFLVWGMTPGTRTVVPISAYLILGTPSPILVDTGMPFEADRHAKSFHVFTRTREQRLDAALGRHDLTPADIGLLVLTHLHSDHTGGIAAFPAARIAIQRRELQYAAAPHFPASMYDRRDIARLVGPVFERIDLLDGDRALADGVRAVWTGGHSPGHQQIEVELHSGLAIVTGDNAYLAEPSVTEQVPPGYVTSIDETMRALEQIRRQADHVLPMHDPAVYERYPHGVW